MKNFKRVLALVLVIASLMALTVSGAAFTDDDKIQHKTAVELLAGLGVIDGFTDGSYKPENIVTRVQMAKMITTILNSGVDVGDLYKAACSFPDSVANWGAGYIAFCAQSGIVAGKSETVFDPNAPVKGVEALKMALCAIGYDAATSGLTGTNWASNTITYARNAGLLTDLAVAKLNEGMTRDEAAQLLYNALLAETVVYSSTASTIIVGDTTIVTGGSAAQATGDLWVEECFPDLAEPAYKNDSKTGAPYWSWELDGKEIATTPVTLSKLGQNASTLKVSDVYTLIGKAAATNSALTVKVFMDGKDMSITPIDITSADKNTTAAAENIHTTDVNESLKKALQEYAKKTFTTTVRDYIKHDKNSPSWKTADVYFDEDALELTIVITNKFYGAVSALSPDKKTVTVTANNRFVDSSKPIDDTYLANYTTQAPAYWIQKLDLAGGGGTLLTFDYKSSAASTLKVGDVVEYTLSYDDAAACKYVVTGITSLQADKKTGTITQENYDGTNSWLSALYIDGSKISWALSDGYIMPRRSGMDMNFNVGDEVDYWLNSEGKLVYMLQSKAAGVTEESKYAYVLAADKIPSKELFAATTEDYFAQLVLADGTVAAVQTKADATALLGKVVTYTEKDGIYTLVDASATEITATTALTPKKVDTLKAGTIANNKTLFVVETKDSKGKSTFTTYTGIANVPNGSFLTGSYIVDGSKVKIAFLFDLTTTAAPAAATDTFGFVVNNTATKRNIATKDGTINYYEVVAFMDGKSQTIKVDAITGLTTIVATSKKEKGNILPFFSYKVDENGIYTLDYAAPSTYNVTEINLSKGADFTAYADGVIVVKGANCFVEADVPVYVYDISDKAITTTTIGSYAKSNYTDLSATEGTVKGSVITSNAGEFVCFAMIKA